MGKGQNTLNTDFAEKLRVEGVGYKGFGIIPKYVMLDTSLTIEAKSIYAYLCSLAGNGSTAFPSRDTILSCLQINKDTYYKHFSLLTAQGYISKEQQRNGRDFGSNLYTIVSNPKKFEDKPEVLSREVVYSKIRFSGLKAAGYGMIPYAVMIDSRLDIKAKGVYAYFCSYTGGGSSAFPKRDRILYYLNLSEKTYYKYYNQLLQHNYMTIQQRTVKGKFNVNDYFLNDNPDIAQFSVVPCGKISDTLKPAKPCSNSSDTQIPDTLFSDTQIPDTTINKTNTITSSYKNQSIYQQSVDELTSPGSLDGLMDYEIQDIVFNEIWENRSLPFWYRDDPQRLKAAIHLLAEWENFYPDGYKDELKQAAYFLCVEALLEMCSADDLMKLKGAMISYAKVIEKINMRMEFSKEGYLPKYITLSPIVENAILDYCKACETTEIRNHLQYMKSVVWNVLQVGDAPTYAQIKHDFG